MGKTKLSVHVFGKRKKIYCAMVKIPLWTSFPVGLFLLIHVYFFLTEKKYKEDEQKNSTARNEIAEYITNISEKSK